MATHDYVIANGTGAAVRADLNNALAAIVSNNSGTSEPATTYAYQWWADTTNNVLKIRNSANNAWITLRELDGTMLMEDGSVSAPGLAFASDLDTGFFKIDPNDLGIATGGVQRLRLSPSEAVFNENSVDYDFRVESNGQTHMLFVDAGNDRVGIAKSSPSARFHVGGTAGDFKIAADGATLDFTRNGANYIQAAESSATLNYRSSQHIFTGSSLSDERARIDSSGRLLVGTSSASNTDNDANTPYLQLEGTIGDPSRAMLRCNGGTNQFGAPILYLTRSRGTTSGAKTSVADDDMLGDVLFLGADGADDRRAASIAAYVDGTPGTNDMPGSLRFSTTADGTSSPTERLRIDSSGRVGIKNTSPGSQYFNDFVVGDGSGDTGMTLYAGSSGAANIAFSDATSGTGRYDGYIQYDHNTTSFVIYTNAGNERMRVNGSGTVQIGGSANLGSQRLQIHGGSSTTADVIIANSVASTGQEAMLTLAPANNITGARIKAVAEEDFSVGANRTARLEFIVRRDGTLIERMRIGSYGRSHSFSSDGATQILANANGSGTSDYLIIGRHSSTTVDNGTNAFFVFTNGNVQNSNNSYGQISDVKLKENIVNANSQWDDIKDVQVRNFNFKEETGNPTHTQIGVVAQELETVSPGLVYETSDRDAEGNDLGTVTKSVNYSVLYMKAVKALQEAMDRIETLETKVAALEAG